MTNSQTSHSSKSDSAQDSESRRTKQNCNFPGSSGFGFGQLILYLLVRKFSLYFNVKSLLLRCQPISLCFVPREERSQVHSDIGILFTFPADFFSEVVLAFNPVTGCGVIWSVPSQTVGSGQDHGPALPPTNPRTGCAGHSAFTRLFIWKIFVLNRIMCIFNKVMVF